MFCTCAVSFGAPPNTLTCPVCLGLPGSLPVLNGRAVELGIATALALGCRIQPESQFHRKNYYYPDLPKNYQISQYQYLDHPPLATGGRLRVPSDAGTREVGIRRVHLEEHTGKLVHAPGRSLVDYNRSGTPLMEVVTDPDLRSPEEARLFLIHLRAVLQFAEVTSGRLEEGTFRCDANLSLRLPGGPHGTRSEIKNMNSLRAVERALRFEEARQGEVVARGEPVVQETRHWDEDRQITFSSREKEEAQDYRYFPEPDLMPVQVDPAWRGIDEVPVRPEHLAGLLSLVDAGQVSGRSAKEILEEMLRTGRPAEAIVQERGLAQISDEASLAAVVQQVIAEHPGPVGDVRAGKDQAVTFLVGQVMKKTRGRANPGMVNRLIRDRLRAG